MVKIKRDPNHINRLELNSVLFKVDCVWSDWKVGDCSVSCGPGTKRDVRTKLITEKYGGSCIGKPVIISECHDKICPGERIL